MGQHDAPIEEHVAEQKIVDVATMAGHVNQGVVPSELPGTIEVPDRHPVVKAIPEPAQQPVKKAYRRIGNVRNDLLSHGSGIAPGPFPGLVSAVDGRAHPRILKHLPQEGATVGQVRAQKRFPVPPKVLPQ